MVAATGPPGAVGGCDQGIGFSCCEELEHRFGVPFGWDRKDAGDRRSVFELAWHGMGEDGPDRAESCVTGRDAVAAFMLKVVEEGGDVRGIEMVEIDALGSGGGPVGEERDEHPPRVPVRGDRVLG